MTVKQLLISGDANVVSCVLSMLQKHDEDDRYNDFTSKLTRLTVTTSEYDIAFHMNCITLMNNSISEFNINEFLHCINWTIELNHDGRMYLKLETP